MGDLNQTLLDLAHQLGPAVLLLLAGIGFSQTGLLLGPLVPGNAILFALGVLTAADNPLLTWPNVVCSFLVGALIGNAANYFQGIKLGRKLFEKRETGIVSQASLTKTEAFFAKHGRMTLLLSPFVPIVRSFAPFVAGLGEMPFRGFFGFAALGVALWIVVLVSLGAGLSNVPWIKDNLGIFMLVIMVVATSQLIFALTRKKKIT